MKNRLATWLVIGMLPLLVSCAASSNSVVRCPGGRPWDDAMAKSEADIVRLPDGRIVGLLPPEGTP